MDEYEQVVYGVRENAIHRTSSMERREAIFHFYSWYSGLIEEKKRLPVPAKRSLCQFLINCIFVKLLHSPYSHNPPNSEVNCTSWAVIFLSIITKLKVWYIALYHTLTIQRKLTITSNSKRGSSLAIFGFKCLSIHT